MLKLADLYAKLPSISCKGLCHDACGVIMCSKAEKDAIAVLTGRRVKTIPDVVAPIHKNHVMLRPTEELNCSYLKKQRCTIYSARPMICRLYGVADGMLCPHGCIPSRVVSKQEAHDLVEAAAEIK